MKRFFKRTLAVLITAIMLVGVAPLGIIDLKPEASAKTIEDCSVGDTITFGSYPQSKVTDSKLVSTLNRQNPVNSSWVSYGYYSGTGDIDDGNMEPSDYMKYKDVTYNGVKYRGIYFTAYRPYYTGGNSSSSYSYQDDNGYYANTAYWFKYEPLTWRVLDPSVGFVMCNKAIDSQAYQNFIYYNSSKGEYYNSKSCTNYASDWATSSIREWLNDDFYNTAFTASEKSKIGTSHLENKSTYNSKYDSSDTYNKIFLLSYFDVINSSYGFNSPVKEDNERQLKSTDYAQAQGCWKSTYTGYSGNSPWRLRLPTNSIDTATVGSDGYAYNGSDAHGVDDTSKGVVPAFRFELAHIHEYADTITPPDCTNKGYTTHTCDCGESYVDSFVDATGHTPGDWVITSQPTHTQEGIKELICKSCGASIDISIIPVLQRKVNSVNINDIKLNYKKSTTLNPQINADDGASYTVTYTSSNPKVASVDENGNVKANKKGTAQITVTVTDTNGNTVTGTCNVKVKYNFGQWLLIIILFGWFWYI